MSRPPGIPNTEAHIAADGLLASRCWCDTMIVRVTPADVLNGRTLSCGADRCGPSATAEWTDAWLAQHTRKAR